MSDSHYDKSFIVVIERMKQQALEVVRRSDPSVESQFNDGRKIGYLYALQDIEKAFKNYE